MQENEFEKKVRSLMDDLEIAPSAPVWDYVEKRIPKSNRRRRFIAFFFLLAGFAVCGHFFYNKFSGNRNEIEKANAVVQQKNIASQKNNENNIAKNNQPKYADSSTTIHEPAAIKNEKLVLNDHPQQRSLSQKKERGNTIHATEEIDSKNESIISNAPINNNDNNKKNNPLITAGVVKQNEISIPDEPMINKNVIDSGTISTQQADITATAGLKTNDTTKQNTQTKKLPGNSKKIEWGFSLLYGKSDIVQTLISLNKDKSLAEAIYSPGNIAIDSIQAAQASRNIKAKSAFSLGVTVRKQLSSRSSISTGLEFMHMNTAIQTGNARDSSAVFDYNNSSQYNLVRSFYRPGTGFNVVNKYNLLQLPVLYSYQFNKSKKVPLTIDAGLSYARIISANAVIYDSYNQVYYKNTNLLQKNQVQLLGGFTAAIIFHDKSHLYVGPHVQYGLTDVIKNSSNKQHFFVWGIGATYFLKK
ncbi:PorT family protein [Panacibacter ginsenosidivorans]|uniref:PorT family protein n=1 Tax=Panacibacter ginsenosidivorans TaxID=1813871 RepID=A0A5B8V5R7_9BACT|nr:outer membrane beta-barrel protein [Panacibacter ginsenosidivorans]QEC66081.1 PorT family protein [Panacibacter ginsenosidivorans]